MTTVLPTAAPPLTPTTSRGRRRLVATATVLALGASALAIAPTAQAANPAASATWLDYYFNNTAVGDSGSNYADFDNLGSFLIRSNEDGVGLKANTEYTLEQDPTLKFSVSGGVAGQPDNVAFSSGTTTLDTHLGLGSGATTAATKIAFVGAATNGSKTVSATLHFADSSTQSINAQFSDWCDRDPQGTNTSVARWTQRWYSGSAQTLACGVWATETYTLAPTTPGSPLESIDFGSAANFHLFGIASDAVVNPAAIQIVGSTPPALPSSVVYEPSGVVTASGAPSWSTSAGPVASPKLTYVWQLDGVTVANASGASYSLQPDDAGKELTVSLAASAGGYLPGTVTSAPVTIAKGTFTTTTSPTISATTARVGDTLSVSSGTYSVPTATESYAWLADGNPIAGATSSSFTVPAAQLGKALSVKVTASQAGYNDVVTTLGPTTAVAQGVFTTSSNAVIGGSYIVGQTLSATAGSYSTSGVSETYQWTANGTDIAGATSATLALTPAQLDATIGLKVTAAKSGYESLSYAVTGQVVSKGTIVLVTAPAVTGAPVFGRTLTASAGAYSPASPAVTYEWLAGNAPLAGATSSTHVPTAAEIGKTVQVKVTAATAGYADLVTVVTVGTVAKEALTVTKSPALSGTVAVGSKVNVVAGAYSAAGVTVSYQWLANGAAISKAVGTSYTPVASDKNKGLSVRVTATKAGYASAVTTTSQVTVKAGTIKVTKKPAISKAKKNAKVGKKLKVSKGSYGTAGVKVTYQWYRGSKKIKGSAAKKAKYKVKSADRRKKLSVKVTVKKSGYTTITVKTKATKKVR